MLLLMLFLACSWGVFSSAPTPWQGGLDATYLDGPRRDDGSIDYISALNSEVDQEIGFEQNAAKWYLDAWDTEGENEFMLEEYEFRFGWDREAFPHKLITPSETWFDDQQEWLANGTVVGADLQEIRAWVTQQQAIVDHILEGTSKDYCFIPIVSADRDGELISALLGPTQATRGYARLLHIRAMISLVDGDFDAAHSDAMAIRRLGRHVGTMPMSVTLYLAYAMERMANKIDQRIFASPGVTTEQVRQYLSDIESLAPIPPMPERVVHAERIGTLDIAMQLSRGTMDMRDLDVHLPAFLIKSINWEQVLVQINQQYDHLKKLLAIEDIDERDAAILRMEQSFYSLRQQLPHRIARSIFSRTARSHLAKDILCAMMFRSMSGMLRGEAVLDTEIQITKLSGLLAIYRAEHGEYPTTLAKLAPDYIDEIPQDASARKPYVYQKVGDTFMLYGAGHNGNDDGGPARIRALMDAAQAKVAVVDDVVAESPGWQLPIPQVKESDP